MGRAWEVLELSDGVGSLCRGEAVGVWVLALMEVGPGVGGGVQILDVGRAESLRVSGGQNLDSYGVVWGEGDGCQESTRGGWGIGD